MPLDAFSILVADDDADMRLYVTRCLRGFGAATIEAADGLMALRLAHSSGVGLVVTDLVMPGLDGLALCRALRADPATAAIPLLLVTGEAAADSRGPPCPDGFLRKPFNAAGLRAEVERVLARSL